MTPTLRPLVPGDLDAVLPLEAELFGRGKWTRGMFLSELSAPRRHYQVAERAGGIVGYAGIALGETSQVMTIGVHPGHRRQGIGRMLLSDLLEAARRFGAMEAILEVRIDAAAPQAMYTEFGFTPMGVRKNYYQAEGIDALVMHKQLRSRIGPVGSEVTE